MKPSQWIGALLVLVGMVFIVTFATNYVGTSAPMEPTPTDSSDAELPTLTFFSKRYPDEGFGTLTLEHKQPGHQDYWFENDGDKEVRVGAVSKSCKCQSVVVFVLPEDFATKRSVHGASQVASATGGLLALLGAAAATDNPATIRDLESQAERTTLDAQTDAPVPAGRVGWVRMTWTGEKPGPQLFSAVLWMHHSGSGLNVTLERRGIFYDAVRLIEPERILGYLRPENLPRKDGVLCFSSTRKAFKVTKAEAVPATDRPPSADALSVGTPTALTPAECREMETKFGDTRVVSGYFIPVTLQSVAADGKTPIDFGNFRRRLLISTDALEEPLAVVLVGAVLGDVQVGGTEDRGRVSFGSFRQGSGPTRHLTLSSESTDAQLELIADRTPKFLQAKLTSVPIARALGKSWELEVTALPAARGRFPRDDDPSCRDSAVYVRTLGPRSQIFRIPVEGDSVDR